MNLLLQVKSAFQLTQDLVEKIDQESLNLKIPNVKSNSIGEQFWCMIGARESYIKAIENEAWIGFSCSLKNSFSKLEILEKLSNSLLALEKIGDNLSLKQQEILLDLYTHEIQHHGQLIRFIYALNIEFPKSWNKKYTV